MPLPRSSPSVRLGQAHLDNLVWLAYAGDGEPQHVFVAGYEFGFESLQSPGEISASHKRVSTGKLLMNLSKSSSFKP
jgi:hypothetical protein